MSCVTPSGLSCNLSSELLLALSGRTVTFSAKPAGSKPWEGHVAAAQKKSQQWCLTLTPNNTETIERMTSLFSAANQERPFKQLLHNYLGKDIGADAFIP